jgi:polysaccharide chain length determinant protein (PEP-CTERM system associated)
MNDILRQLITILRGMWQRRWIGLGVAWLVGVVGAIVLINIPDRYEASARIYVDTQSVLKPLLSGLAIQPDVEQQVTMLARTLINRPNMEKLMRSSDMDLLVSTQREKERLIDDLTKEIKLAGGGRENLYYISYRDTNPDRARRVVQNLVSMFVESGLGDKRRDAAAARKFIDDQIATHEKKLEEAENRVKEFRLKNFGFTGGTGQDYLTRLTALSNELNNVRLELRSTEEARDALKKELSGENPVLLPEAPAAMVPTGNPRIAELDARIDMQQRQLDEMLRRYTEQHPDVVMTQRLIKQLEEQRQQEIEAHKKVAEGVSAGKPVAPTNPVFQQIKVSLAESEARIAALRARGGELAARIEALRASAERVPKIEAELAQMNRDYDILKRNYEQLVTRREQASMSGNVDEIAGMAEFRLIDPPRSSPRPVFPDRLAIVSLVLALSIGGGLFAAFAVAQILPTVQDTRSLRQITNRPVLGTVSMLANAQLLRRRRIYHAAFGSGAASLVTVYGAWIAWIAWTLRN